MSMEARKSAAPAQEEMNVYLKIVKTVPMKVKRTDTIATLKEHIKQNQGVAEINQKLLFDGKLLSNAQTMADSGIQNYATLHLFVNDNAAMKLFIKMPCNNKIITLEAKANEIVQNIKLMIQEKEGIQPNSFTLVYNGNQLEDERILTSVGIGNNSTIHLLFCEKEVTFSVKAPGIEALKLSAKRMFSVGDVKALAMDMLGVDSSKDMGLFDNGKLLDDSKTVDVYDIGGSCLDLLSTAPMEIVVKDLRGRTLTLNVQVLETVKDVLKKAEKIMKSNPDIICFKLHDGGKYLSEYCNLAYYRIQQRSTLYVLARYRA